MNSGFWNTGDGRGADFSDGDGCGSDGNGVVLRDHWAFRDAAGAGSTGIPSELPQRERGNGWGSPGERKRILGDGP